MLPGIAALKRMPRLALRGRGRWVSLIVGVLLLCGSGTQAGIAWATALPTDAVLRTNGIVVTKDQFQHRISVLNALYGVEAPKDAAGLDKFNRDAAKSMAVSMVLDRATQDRSVVVADKTAQDTLDQLIQQKVPNGRDAFEQFLGTHGISETDVLDEIKRQLATNRLTELVAGNVAQVADNEVKATYDSRKASMVSPERRHLRNIVVSSKEEADGVLSQARAGADFAGLATVMSLDQSTKVSGGDLGTVSADQLDAPYAKAAFAAPVNSVFGPVQTKSGWNVGKVDGIEPGQPLSYDQVKDELKTELQNERQLDTWRKWLAGQLTVAKVEYADSYRPADPDAPPVDASH